MRNAPDTNRASRGVDGSKRRLFGFRAKGDDLTIRPPWTDSATFTDLCTRCDACIGACPARVLLRGDGGFPEFDPKADATACTFCGACADACSEGLFDRQCTPPLEALAAISTDACLPKVGIHCECCRDACDQNALRFRPKLGGPPSPVLDAERCTGCGACLSVCPNNAIELVFTGRTKEAA